MPPLDSTYRKCAIFSRFTEPWNIRCSKRWAKPVRPSGSERKPTSYRTAMPTTGAERSGPTSTRSPLSRRWWVRSNDGAGSFTGTLSPYGRAQRVPAGLREAGPEVGRGLGALVEHREVHLLVRGVDLVVGQPDTEEHQRPPDRLLQRRLRATAALAGRQDVGPVEGRADRVGERAVRGGAEGDEAGPHARPLPLDGGGDAFGRVVRDELLDAPDDLGRILVGDQPERQLGERVARD